MEYLIALLPIISLLIIMVVFEKPAYFAGPVTLFLTTVLAIIYLTMDLGWLVASIVRGIFISADIMLIVAGVFLLVSVLKKSNAFYVLKVLAHKISSDARIQLIFLAWFAIAFLEGVAGFGTPPMIIVPIMIALGFSPLASVVATLIGDSVACTFGAAGTPMLIGIADGVSNSQAGILGIGFLSKVTVLTSFFHLLVGSLLPLFIVCIVTYIHDKNIKRGLEVWKLAILSGVLFLLPSFFINYVLGPEFPSILGSLIGMLLFVFVVKRKIFIPTEKWVIEKDLDFLNKKDKEVDLDYMRALFPYAVAVILLVVSRVDLAGVGNFLKTIQIPLKGIFGTTVSYTLYPLYSPGFFFIIAALLAFYIYRMSDKSAEHVVKMASAKLLKTFVALVSILSIVQIMIYSSYNTSGNLGFLGQLAELFTSTGMLWPFFSPFLGLFGAFLAGSSTVSNLMFSSVQIETAMIVGMSPILSLALQSVGSALGNMFAIHNIIAAGAVAHLSHPEGKVIKYTIIPALFIAFVVGILAFIFS